MTAPQNITMLRDVARKIGLTQDGWLNGSASRDDEPPPVDSFDAYGQMPTDAQIERCNDEDPIKWEWFAGQNWITCEPPSSDDLRENPELYRALYARPALSSTGQPTAPTAPQTIRPITPAVWEGTEPIRQRWHADARIPCGDLTIFSGNGGSGKTETITQLLVYTAAGLSDWLGCSIEGGAGLFLSCEEPEHNIRDRVERICKHRAINPYDLPNLHMVFPDLEATWLAHATKDGRLAKAPLMEWLEAWIIQNRPRLVVIDSIAAVFDGEAIARRQVRAFLAMLRKIAREHDVAIVLLDHPSVRGMADGSGTANSVDWRNSVRSMLHLSDPEKDDQDVRTLEVKKSNYGRSGEKVTLRWNGLTFTTAMAGEASPYRAAAERDIEELFLRLLEKRNAQGRPVHASTAKGSAPAEFAADPEAKGVTAEAFRAAMERLFTSGRIITVETGSPSKRRKHIERVS